MFSKEKKMRGKKLKKKNLSRFLFFINMFRWKKNEKKNRRRIISSYLFVRKRRGKKKK